MFKDYQQNQGQLLPQSLSDSISSDHTARLINQVIDEMDLSFIEGTVAECLFGLNFQILVNFYLKFFRQYCYIASKIL